MHTLCSKMLTLFVAVTASGADWTGRVHEARRLMETNSFSEAVAAYQNAAKLANDAKENPATLATIHCELGWAMSEAGDADTAIREMIHALSTLRQSGQDIRVAVCANHLALHYRTIGRYEESRHLFQEALGIEEKLSGRENQRAKVLIGLAGLELLGGFHARADQHGRRALQLLEKAGPMTAGIVEACSTLALAARAMERPADAIAFAERELNALRNSPSATPEELIRPMSLLAATNAELKRFRKAAQWTSQIEALQTTDESLRLKILMTLAYVSSQQGDMGKAEHSFDEARRLIEQQPNADRMALGTVWMHLGRVRRRQGNYEGSEQCHKTAISMLSGTLPERHPFIAFGWLDLADTYRLLRRYDDAIAHYRKGLTMAEESVGKGSGLLAVDYAMFAEVLRKKNEKAEAREYAALAKKAKEGSEQIRTMGFTVDIDELAPKRR